MKIKKSAVKFIISIILIICTVLIAYFSFPVVLSALSYIIRLFLPFILGYVFAVLVKPLVVFLQNKLKIPDGIAAILVMILIIGVLGSILGFAIYKFINEVRNLYFQIPKLYANLELDILAFRDSVMNALSNLPEGIQNSVVSVFNNIIEKLGEIINSISVPMVNTAGSFAKALPKAFISIIVFLLSSFFMLSDFEKVSGIIKKVFKVKSTGKLARVKYELKNYLGGYLKAQLIIMSIAFVIMFISFHILSIKYAVLIALGVAFLDALPFFGSGAVLWPWSVISFMNGDLKLGFGIIITYVIIFVTRQMVEPKIVSDKIGMHPLLTLMAMYVGYRLFSIGGMILGPIIMMTIISFYRAGVFDVLLGFLKSIWLFIKKEFLLIKNYIQHIWDSDDNA